MTNTLARFVSLFLFPILSDITYRFHSFMAQRRRKFTVGFDCVRTTNDAAEYPHFVYKYSPTIQHMSNQSDSSIELGKLLRDFADLMIRMIHVLPPFTIHRFSQLMRIDDECIFSTGSLRKLLCLYQLKHIPLVKIISS